MTKKNLLMCYHSAEYGGVEKQILDIIAGLHNDFKIYVVCPEGPLVESYLKAGAVKHINLKPKRETDLGYSFRIANLIKDMNIDVIHSHELLAGCLGTFGGMLGGCPKRIYHVHTPFSMWKHAGLKRYFAQMINTMVNYIVGNFFATDVIALTESIKKVRISKEHIFEDKIRVIPNGVDLDIFKYDQSGRSKIRNRFKISDDTIVIGHIGRFTEEKRQDWLISSVSDFLKSGDPLVKNIKLVLGGSGKLMKSFEKLAEAKGIKDNVIFMGAFDENEKPAILSALDLFVLPSVAEGFGIALIEAMAVGLPCLASNLPVLKDVGGSTVKYFDTTSHDSLTQKMYECVDDLKNLHSESHKNLILERVKKYDMRIFWKHYKDLYNS